LNLARVEAPLDLRKIENIFYPPALQIAAPPSFQATIQPTPKALITTQPLAKASTTTQPVDVGTTKVTSEPSKAPKEKEVEHSEPPPSAKMDPPPSISS